MAWTWTNHQLSRFQFCQLFHGNSIIAVDSDSGTFEDQILVDVPRERIEVVNEDDIGRIRKGRGCFWLLRRVVNQVESCHFDRAERMEAVWEIECEKKFVVVDQIHISDFSIAEPLPTKDPLYGMVCVTVTLLFCPERL